MDDSDVGHLERSIGIETREPELTPGHTKSCDSELLERLLIGTVPGSSERLLARRMLREFGDLGAVVAASESRIQRFPGANKLVATRLKVVEDLVRHLARARIRNRSILSSWDALIEYCRVSMAHRGIEQLRVFFLDKKNVLIADEVQWEGTVDQVPVYPREIVRRALELNASALIIVHNHPSGDTTPSEPDYKMTSMVESATSSMGIVLHDHVIVGKEGVFSFRGSGFFNDVQQTM